jgi:Porin PorA
MRGPSERLRALRRHRANLVLVVAGCVLILLSPVWRFAVATALKVEPTDLEQVLYYDGSLTDYVNPPGQPPAGTQPVVTAVRIDRTILSKPLLSTSSVSVVEVETRLVAQTRDLSDVTHSYTLDRKTGEMVDSPKADRSRTGYYIVFPFNAPRGEVPFWSELTGKTHPAEFEKEDAVYGLPVYIYTVSFGNQPVVEAPAGFPASLDGAALKEMLSMPDLSVADTETVTLSYTASSTVELKVEPRMGNIVETRGEESVSLSAKDAAGSLIVTRALNKLEFNLNQTSVKASAQFAREEVSKLNLQFVYLPLGLLVLGLGIVLIGLFAGIKPQTRSV